MLTVQDIDYAAQKRTWKDHMSSVSLFKKGMRKAGWNKQIVLLRFCLERSAYEW